MTKRTPKNIFVAGPIAAAFVGESIHQHSTKTGIGAHSIFLGQVRADMIGDQPVTAIEYTTYEAMAIEKMHEIRTSIFDKYALTCMHVYHSTVKCLPEKFHCSFSLLLFTGDRP